MFNVLTDVLPNSYEGYLINYQYYSGILINECLKDSENLFGYDEYGKIQKLYTAFTILYGRGIPELDTALDGLNWFMSCGLEKSEEKEENKEYFDFNIDGQYLYSAFRVKYGINLAKEKGLHWFEFIYLFSDLSKTAFREIVNLRMMKPSEYRHYSREFREEILKQKRKFALRQNDQNRLTEDEKGKIDLFYNLINKKK